MADRVETVSSGSDSSSEESHEEVEEEVMEEEYEDDEEILEEEYVENPTQQRGESEHSEVEDVQYHDEVEAGEGGDADADADVEAQTTDVPEAAPGMGSRNVAFTEDPKSEEEPKAANTVRNNVVAFFVCISFIAAIMAAIAIPLGLRRYGGGKTLQTTRGTPSGGDDPSPSSTTAPAVSEAPVMSPTAAPGPTTGAPTSVNLNQFLENFLVPRFGEEAFEDPNSDTYKAAEFLANNDPFIFDGPVTSEEQLGDRYAAVVMYYALNGESWTGSNWLQGDHCGWTGIEACNAIGRVTAISLSGEQLNSAAISGTIPPQISLMTELEEFTIENENIGGKIPATLPVSLSTINLGGNSLTGFLPDELLTLVDLTTLDLSDNSLEGPLSSRFSELSALEDVYLSGNSFSGTVPAAFGSLENLNALAVENNDLTGSIPESLCGLGLTVLSSDCNTEVTCSCCTSCA